MIVFVVVVDQLLLSSLLHAIEILAEFVSVPEVVNLIVDWILEISGKEALLH